MFKNNIRHNSSIFQDFEITILKIKNPTSNKLTVKITNNNSYRKVFKKALTLPKIVLNSLYKMNNKLNRNAVIKPKM